MADPTRACLAIPEARIKFLRLHHGATDENSDASIPKKHRKAFDDRVEYNRQFAARWFEKACRYYDGYDGTWASVPESRREDAIRYFGRAIHEHDSRCQFELELKRIELEEEAAEAEAAEDDLDFG